MPASNETLQNYGITISHFSAFVNPQINFFHQRVSGGLVCVPLSFCRYISTYRLYASEYEAPIYHIKTMQEMLIKDFLPAVNRYAAAAAKQVSDKKALLAGLSTASEEALVSNLTEISNSIAAGVTTLKEATAKDESTVDMQKQADLFLTEVLPVMEELKNAANEAEIKIPDEILPYPTYDHLLFYV